MTEASTRSKPDLPRSGGRRRADSEQQSLLMEISKSLPGAMYQVRVSASGELRLGFVSEGLKELVGVSKEDAEADIDRLYSLILTDDVDKLKAAIVSAAKGRETLSFDFQCRHALSGKLLWLRSRARAVQMASGEVLCHGFWQEITDIKAMQAEMERAQQQAEQAEQRVREITESLPGVVYRMEFKNGERYFTDVTDGAQSVFGFSREQVLRDPDLFSRQLHPEDHQHLMSGFKDAVQSKEQAQTDFRFNKPDGTQVWLRTYSGIQEIDGGISWSGYTTDVTAEHAATERAEQARRELIEARDSSQQAEQRLRAIFDYNRIGLVMINQDRSFSNANPSLRELLDIEDEEEFARDFPLFSPPTQPDGCESVPKAMEMIEIAFEKGYHRFDWIHQTRAGDPRPCEVALTRVNIDGRPQLFATMTDHRERARHEAEVASAWAETRSAQERLAAIFDNIGIGVVMVDANGVFTDPNPALGRLLEMTEEDDFSRDFAQFSPEYQPDGEASAEKAPKMIGKAFTEGHHRFYWMHQTRDGRPRPFEISVTRVELGGRPIAFAAMSDLREREKNEADLKVASERAQAASQAKSDFLANMSHEIRTPMNAIVGLSHLGLTSDDPQRMQDYLRKIDAASKSLLQIINDILDFSKIEAGKLSLESADFNLFSVLDNLSDMLNLRAAEKGLELLFDIEPDLSGQLQGDPLRLGQVLLNLTGNAIKFTERGQVVVRAKAIKRAPDFVRIRFEVADTGIGISQAQQERLFESFSQADTSTTRQYGGTGLGLVISQRLVDLMDGEIDLQSEPGRGSTFSFSARFSISSAGVKSQAAPPSALRGAPVLVVDDNPTAISILQAHLESFGFEVSTANSGEQAIHAVRSAGARGFRLVLMDWQMPGMDGIETARRIRSMATPQPAQIIMVTAYGREEVERQAKQSGLDGFLVKPVNPSVLLDTIVDCFGETPLKQPATGNEGAVTAGELRGRRVLLVEDNEINMEVACELLEREGIFVEVAVNGAEAVSLAEQNEFDVVLMDMQMPVMDGIDATRRIRAFDSPAATVPIIAMTANAMEEDRKRCVEAGMNDHLGKPVDVQRMREVLLRWMPLPKQMAQVSQQASPGKLGSAEHRQAFDFAEAIRKMADSHAMWKKYVQRFLQTEEAADQIGQLITSDDRPAAVRRAHSLKGTAATLGLVELSRVAAALEAALKRDAGSAEGELSELRQAESVARQALRRELA